MLANNSTLAGWGASLASQFPVKAASVPKVCWLNATHSFLSLTTGILTISLCSADKLIFLYLFFIFAWEERDVCLRFMHNSFAVQRQRAVTAYLKRNQLLVFVLALQSVENILYLMARNDLATCNVSLTFLKLSQKVQFYNWNAWETRAFCLLGFFIQLCVVQYNLGSGPPQ